MKEMTGTPDTNVIMRICSGTAFSRRHPLGVAVVRLLVAVWLLALASVFCANGQYWGVALLAPAALHLWIAYRLAAGVRVQA
jgi:hypothetical protein